MNIGKLDRRVSIQSRILTKDDAGGIIESWQDVCFSWAEKLEQQKADQSGGEKVTANADKAMGQTLWRIRYKSTFRGVTTAGSYRLIYGGEVFDITHVKEEGRKVSMILTTQTTEGIAQ